MVLMWMNYQSTKANIGFIGRKIAEEHARCLTASLFTFAAPGKKMVKSNKKSDIRRNS